MHFKTDLVSQLLRIITPAIIAEMSTDSSGKKKVSLSEIVHEYWENGHYHHEDDEEADSESPMAKILPFASDDSQESVENKKEKLVYQSGQRVCALLEEFTDLCKKMESNLLGPKRIPKRKISGGTLNSSEYMIEQKKQFERSYALLKSQEVLNLYKAGEKNTLNKNDKNEEEKKEDFLTDQERGILVNKKQA